MHGSEATNWGKLPKVQMTQEAQLQTYQIQDHSKEQDRYYQHVLTNSIDWATRNGMDPDPFQDPELSDIITTSYLVTPFDPWCDKFKRAHKAATLVNQRGERYARTIQHALSTPEVKTACLFQYPDLDWVKYFPHPGAPEAPEKIQPEATPNAKPSRHKPRKQTITEYVTNQAPSISYLQTFFFITRHTKNRFSGKGRKVYPYGQEHVSRNLKLSLRTVRRVFLWLRRKHIIFKRSNENPDLHKSATWFICTSWSQSIYFRDPQGRRQKKGSPRCHRK